MSDLAREYFQSYQARQRAQLDQFKRELEAGKYNDLLGDVLELETPDIQVHTQIDPNARVTAGDVLADIGGGLLEAPKQILGGVRDAVVEIGQTVESLTSWATGGKVPLRLGTAAEAVLPEVGKAETVTGGIVRGASQFIAAFLPAARALKAAGVTGTIVNPAAAGAIADIAAFDPRDPNVSKILNDWGLTPEFLKPLTNFLETDASDNEATARFKNALEGLGLGLLAEGVIRTARLIRNARHVQPEVQAAARQPAAQQPHALPEFGTPGPTVQAAAPDIQAAPRALPGQAPRALSGGPATRALPEFGSPGPTVQPPRRGPIPAPAPAGTQFPTVPPKPGQAGFRLGSQPSPDAQIPPKALPEPPLPKQAEGVISEPPQPGQPFQPVVEPGATTARGQVQLLDQFGREITTPALIDAHEDFVTKAEAIIVDEIKRITQKGGMSEATIREWAEAAGLRYDGMYDLTDIGLENRVAVTLLDPDPTKMTSGAIPMSEVSPEGFKRWAEAKRAEFAQAAQAAQAGAPPTPGQIVDAALAEIASGGLTPETIARLAEIPELRNALPPESLAESAAADVAQQLQAQPFLDRLVRGESPEDIRRGFLNDVGQASPQLLARLAAGAVLGASTGEDVETSIRNAFIGAGLAALPARTIARSLARTLKDETGAMNFWGNWERAKKAREPYQPNFNRIQAEADVKKVLRNIHRMVGEEIEAGAPPTTHAKVKAEAEALKKKIKPQDVLSWPDGKPISPAEGKLARDYAVSAAAHVLETAAKILRGETVNPGALRQAIIVAGQLAKKARTAQRVTAQTLESFKIDAQPGDVFDLKRIVDLADTLDPGLSDMELAELLTTLKEPKKVGRFAEVLSSGLPRAILEAYYASLLSGMAVVRNALGNLAYIPMTLTARTIAPYIPRIGKAAKVNRVYVGEGTEAAIGAMEGLKEQFRLVANFGEWVASGRRAAASKIEQQAGLRGPAITAENLGLDPNNRLGHAVDVIGHIVRTPLAILNATDRSIRAVHGLMEMRAQAFRQAVSEGRTGNDLTKRVVELMENPAGLNDAAILAIEEAQLRGTFVKNFEGRIMRGLQAGPQNDWAQLAYRVFVAPFVRTPVRLAEVTGEFTPGLNLFIPHFWEEFRAGGARQQVALAKVATGTAVIGTFAYLAAQGLIIGHAPKDPKLRKLWEDAGYQELSWWDPVNKTYRSYRGLEPLSNLIAAAADMVRFARYMNDDEYVGLVWAAIAAEAENLGSTQYLQSVAQFIEAVSNPQSDSRAEDMLRFLRKRLGSFSPGLFGELEKLTDPEIRRAQPGRHDSPLWREFRALMDHYRLRTPFFSDAKDEKGEFLVPPEVNLITGEDIVGDLWPFHPFAGREPKQDVVFDELMKFQERGVLPISEIPDRVGRLASEPILGPNVQWPGIRLTPQERYRWAKLMTQEVKNARGQTLHQALTELVQSDRYKRASDDVPNGGKLSLISRTYEDYKERAYARLLRENTQLREEIEQRRLEFQLQRVPEGARRESIRDLHHDLMLRRRRSP